MQESREEGAQVDSKKFSQANLRESHDFQAPVILMVSGGADSVALFMRVLQEPVDLLDGFGAQLIDKDRLHVLHINHGLRGTAADEDACFVVSLARDHGVACTIRTIDVAQSSLVASLGFEGAARHIRYEQAYALLEELCAKQGCPKERGRIVTGHTADDRAETFLMNALQGAGPQGLGSLHEKRSAIIRPYLHCTHQENCVYLDAQGLLWREDATNEDDTYLRNYIRKHVLSALTHKNPHATQHIAHAAYLIEQDNAYLDECAEKLFTRALNMENPSAYLFTAKILQEAPEVLVQRVIKRALFALRPEGRFESQHIERVCALIKKEKGGCSHKQKGKRQNRDKECAMLSLPCDVSAEYSYGYLCLARTTEPVKLSLSREEVARDSKDKAHIIAEYAGLYLCAQVVKTDDPCGFLRKYQASLQQEGCAQGGGDLNRAHNTPIVSAASKRAYFDLDDIEHTQSSTARITQSFLWVRTAQEGDEIEPFGLAGVCKPVATLYSEARIPRLMRHYYPLVTLDDKTVIWIAGVRQTERFRIHQNTRRILILFIVEQSEHA